MIKAKSEPSAGPVRVEAADPVQQARVRARQRLIGAFVLLVVGIIGFPLVFETEPRPIAIDIPIEIPQREGIAPLAVPAPRGKALAPLPSASTAATDTAPAVAASAPASPPAAVVINESSADSGRDITPPAPRASALERAPARAVETARPAGPDASAPALAAPALAAPIAAAPASAVPLRADDGSRALALLEGRPASSAAAGAGRFVVQVGAFADNDAARDVRRQVERLGLKTYVQVAQTATGSRVRVRVGPFASRGEADAALAKARAAGIDAVVLAL